MRHHLNGKSWVVQSQQNIYNSTLIHANDNIRQVKTVDPIAPISVERVHPHPQIHQRILNDFVVVDKEKEAHTARWVLHVIAAREAYQQALTDNEPIWNSDTKIPPNVI